MDIFSYMLGRKSGGGGSPGGGGGGGGSNEDWIIGDGNTHLWITLPEGRTSPMVGVGVNGTVTVDWGDGTEPDVLTGTSTSTVQWTPNHEYAAAGDYVITLTVDGEMGFGGASASSTYAYILRYSSAGSRLNAGYQNALRKIEIGDNVASIGDRSFDNCYSLSSITISNGVTSIGERAFNSCYSLASITIPSSVTSIGKQAFFNCYSLSSITISNGVTSIGDGAFTSCCSLASITIPSSVTSIGHVAFDSCYSLASITIPNGVTSIGIQMFHNCYSLSSITIPDSVTSIVDNAFFNCYSLASITIPSGVTSIASGAFNSCYSVKFYDFSNHTAVPTLSATNAFLYIASDCEIRVPAALVDEWKAATNWSEYASKIVGV